MALISKRCEYGLRAILHLAAQPDREYVSIREMAQTLDISFHFLTKILQQMTRAGMLTSQRGPEGGVALARPLGKVTLLDVLRAIDERDLFSSCVMGLSGCGDRNPCPLHAQWSKERRRLETMFRRATLNTLAGPIADGTLRLTD